MFTTRLFARAVVPALLLTVVVPALARAQSAADDKELASYRLTMDGLNKMVRVNRALVDELKKDPKYQQLMKAQDDIKALEAKDALTDSEQKQLDDLKARAEQMENQAPGNDLLN
ncbi:MAG TPA: hypothetical protein VNR64_16240, partial [Vicinamibacterales bacterium]|nr:hypothetical protein [Vicinamibacterales bacterium]